MNVPLWNDIIIETKNVRESKLMSSLEELKWSFWILIAVLLKLLLSITAKLCHMILLSLCWFCFLHDFTRSLKTMPSYVDTKFKKSVVKCCCCGSCYGMNEWIRAFSLWYIKCGKKTSIFDTELAKIKHMVELSYIF